jgi:hypothetical protein
LTSNYDFGIDFLRGEKGPRRRFAMPGDPKECREHARNCARLAVTSAAPEVREHFAMLADTWLRLASDLEISKALIEVYAPPPQKRAG